MQAQSMSSLQAPSLLCGMASPKLSLNLALSRTQGCSRAAPARRHCVAASAAADTTALAAERVSLGEGPSAVQIAPIINGCWQLAGGHGRDVFDNIEDKLWALAQTGFTSFDTADIYGSSERMLGNFQVKWAEAGNSPVQLLTKYCPDPRQSLTPATTEAAVQRSMANLQVSSLDLVQMHWWDYSIPGMVDAALTLADLQAKGLIKQIGVTNMNVPAVEQLLDAGVPVVSNQVAFSVLDRRPLNGMLQLCQQRGIKLLTYGSLAGGLLSDKYIEEPKRGLFGQARSTPVDLQTSSLKMYWRMVSLHTKDGQRPWRQLVRTLRQVADRHNGATVANVALAWVMAQGGQDRSVVPIVGLSRRGARVEENTRALELRLGEQDLADIYSALEWMALRGPAGDIYSFERGE